MCLFHRHRLCARSCRVRGPMPAPELSAWGPGADTEPVPTQFTECLLCTGATRKLSLLRLTRLTPPGGPAAPLAVVQAVTGLRGG